MDFFQGSTPPNFIPFRLESSLKENHDSPTTTQASNPAAPKSSATTSVGFQRDEAGTQISRPQELVKRDSPALTQDGDADVTAYAESVVQRMEKAHVPTTQDKGTPVSAPTQSQELGSDPPELAASTLGYRRSSTPVQSDEEQGQEADLSALESVLRVIMSTESQLPELRDKDNSGQINVSDTPSRTDDDNVSSVCDVPALPGGASNVQLTLSRNEEEESTEEASRIIPVELYGYPPFATESGTEGGDETSCDKQTPGTSKGRTSKKQPEQDELPDLLGRSRAILKEYFEEASPIRLPVGHTTIALTEPQVYNLLRILTDETLRRSFTTTKRMVYDAVRGSPTALPSRTAHFQTRGSQTPRRR